MVVLIYRVPKPLLLLAIDIVTSELKLPPPESPLPTVTERDVGTPPNADRAAAALFCPVPPDPIGNGVLNPEICPPLMFTVLEFCTAMVPTVVVAPDANPRLLRA